MNRQRNYFFLFFHGVAQQPKLWDPVYPTHNSKYYNNEYCQWKRTRVALLLVKLKEVPIEATATVAITNILDGKIFKNVTRESRETPGSKTFTTICLMKLEPTERSSETPISISVAIAFYSLDDLGPAKNQTMRPNTGRKITTRIQSSLLSGSPRLPKILMIAQISPTKTRKPTIPPT